MNANRKLAVPDDVLTQVVGDEMVLLHARTGVYYGLDAAGARMFSVVTTAESIPAACDTLLAEYDVEEARLGADVDALVEKLIGLGLLEWKD